MGGCRVSQMFVLCDRVATPQVVTFRLQVMVLVREGYGTSLATVLFHCSCQKQWSTPEGGSVTPNSNLPCDDPVDGTFKRRWGLCPNKGPDLTIDTRPVGS